MSQTFAVTGLHCASCVKHVSAALTVLPGVRSVDVDLNTEGASTVTVEGDRPLGRDEVRTALAEEGDYELVP